MESSLALRSLSPSSASISFHHHHHHHHYHHRRRQRFLRPLSASAAAAIPISKPPPSTPLRSSSPLALFSPLPKPKPKTHFKIHAAAAAVPASSSSPSPQPPAAAQPAGAKPLPLIASVGVGVILRFLVPRPVEVTPQAWQLLAIFLSTVAGLVLGPLPVGAWAFLGLTTAVTTKTLPFTTAFSAFTSEVIWLIVVSFFFARGFIKTGLGDRIANYFVKWLGKSTLGLSYGLTLSEALIAPAMPSSTARAGGVFLPVIKSLSLSSGSRPEDESRKKLGSYLIQTQLQVCS